MTSVEITLRPATPEDIPSINKIHKYYVETSVLTFVTEPNTDEAALENYNNITKTEGLPYIVAENNENKAVIGYTYVSPFRGTKLGYKHTLELSIFCEDAQCRKGLGKQMLLRLIEILKDPEKWKDWFEGDRLLEFKPRQLIACMAVDTWMPWKGLGLRDWYLSLGFAQRGHLEKVGYKKGRWVDTMYMQLQLSDPTGP